MQAIRAAVGTDRMRFAVRKSIARALQMRHQDVDVSETAVSEGRRLSLDQASFRLLQNISALEVSVHFSIHVAELGDGVSDESVVMARVAQLGTASSAENSKFRSDLAPSMVTEAADQDQTSGFSLLVKSLELNSIDVLDVEDPKLVEEIDTPAEGGYVVSLWATKRSAAMNGVSFSTLFIFIQLVAVL